MTTSAPRLWSYLLPGLYLAAIVATLALAWVVVPPILAQAHAGQSWPFLNRAFDATSHQPLDHYLRLWFDLAGAAILALIAHGALVTWILHLFPSNRQCLAFTLFALAFLALTILAGPRQDYAAYLEIAKAARAGGDPWWIHPRWGYPLNAYGPLFLLFVPLSAANPLAPKLLFATAYLTLALDFLHRGPSRRPLAALLFLNPYPWIHFAWYGHFDILVAIACLAAVRLASAPAFPPVLPSSSPLHTSPPGRGRPAGSGEGPAPEASASSTPSPLAGEGGPQGRMRGTSHPAPGAPDSGDWDLVRETPAPQPRSLSPDTRAAFALALGVLLKYLPITLLPFLAIRDARPRPRLALACLLTIAVGLALSLLIWDSAPLRALTFAATRGSVGLSVFRFLRGDFSPLRLLTPTPDLDILALPLLAVAGGLVWLACQVRRIDPPTACASAVLVTLLFFRVGFAQYQVVLFVMLLEAWRTHPARWAAHRRLGLAALAYTAWIVAFDTLDFLVVGTIGAAGWPGVLDNLAGGPTFLLGGWLLLELLRASWAPRVQAA